MLGMSMMLGSQVLRGGGIDPLAPGAPDDETGANEWFFFFG